MNVVFLSFNSNNGPVIFYAEAITYICLSPCLKGKYKLVMPQCSSKSSLHQGHRRARVSLFEIRADHTRYSSITFNRKRYITCCFSPCLKGIRKMFLIAMVSRRTEFCYFSPFLLHLAEIPYILVLLFYFSLYLRYFCCISLEILRTQNAKFEFKMQNCVFKNILSRKIYIIWN